MKALFICLITLSFLWVDSNSQDWNVLWQNQLGCNKMDYFADVVADKNGGYVVLGATVVEGNSYDFWLVYFNDRGDTLWTKTLGTPNQDLPGKIAQVKDGGYLIFGSCLAESKKELLLIKTNEEGVEQWRKVVNDGLMCSGKDMALVNDSSVVLVGSKESDQGIGKLWMANYSLNGNLTWEKLFMTEENGCFSSVKQTPDNGFALAGKVLKDKGKTSDIVLVKTDGLGEVNWITKIESAQSRDWPECVCCTMDSCLLVVGWKGNCLNDINSEHAIFDYDLVLNKIKHNGDLLWSKNFDKEGSEGGNAITVRPDGSIIVAGIKQTSFLGKIGPWLLHVDSDGKELSENLIKFHFHNDNAIKVLNCPDGGFVVIGPGVQEESNNRSNGWIMKFASI